MDNVISVKLLLSGRAQSKSKVDSIKQNLICQSITQSKNTETNYGIITPFSSRNGITSYFQSVKSLILEKGRYLLEVNKLISKYQCVINDFYLGCQYFP